MKKIGQFFYFLLFLTVLLSLGYVFSYPIFDGLIKGNDNTYHLLSATWVNQFLPRLPQWFPLQGGGVSIYQGYQFAHNLYIIFLSKILGITLNQALRLFCFSIVPLVSLGIYFFTWHKFKSQTVALVAGLFYPLSQAAWPWILDIGLLPLASSLIFVAPVFLVFDIYLEKKNDLFFLLSVFTFSLLTFSHIVTAFVVGLAMILYALLTERFSLKSFISTVKVIFFGVLLTAFWLFPFLRYNFLISGEHSFLGSLETVRYLVIPVLLGFVGSEGLELENRWPYLFFARPVLILAFLGMILAFVKKEKIGRSLTAISIIFILLASLAGLLPFLVRLFLPIFSFANFRFIIPTLIFLPVLASFALKVVSEKLLRGEGTLVNFARSFFILTAAMVLVFIFKAAPPLDPNLTYFVPPGYSGLGPTRIYGEKPPWTPNPYLLKRISDEIGPQVIEILNLTQVIPEDVARIDVSGNMGETVKAWHLFSRIPLANIYVATASLNRNFWGYQILNFYEANKEGSRQEVTELAKWWGINYVVLNGQSDPLDRFDPSYWQDVGRSSLESFGSVVKKFKDRLELASLSEKPLILVIGSPKIGKHSFEQIFRTANLGALDFEQGILVEGKEKIDAYSLEELEKFPVVILYGYSYRNKVKAWNLIRDYVNFGGRVFIETGWQYVSPDWQWSQTSEILPIKSLFWTSLDNDWNLEGFSPPLYQGRPWGVSTGKLSDLRSWAKPVITLDDKVLIARGEFGKGKVVWSGMNLVGHTLTYRNQKEAEFLQGEVFSWLTQGLSTRTAEVKIKRTYPDQAEVILPEEFDKGGNLYFREAFYPDWRAFLVSPQGRRRLDIFRAGPGFMTMLIPPYTQESKIVLELDNNLVYLSFLASLLTLVVLTIYVVKKPSLSFPKNKWTQRLINDWGKEE